MYTCLRGITFVSRSYFYMMSGRIRNRSSISEALPYFTEGKVIKGFGRGSKELGIPTANFSEQVVNLLPAPLETGVYYGWARVDNDEVYEMVMSIGWNPYFANKKRSMETHILHVFEKDFYGSWLRVYITGYLRPEKNYDSLNDLLRDIHADIGNAKSNLANSHQQLLKTDMRLSRMVEL